jgi:capsular polysaccharide biosynthesis protein
MEANTELKVLDLVDIAKRIWGKRRLFLKTLSIAFVVSAIFIFGFPRDYATDIKLAPELGGSSMTSTLGSLASSFGFDLDNLQSNDAITPLLYPDLMEDNGFVTGLFNVRVKSADGDINTTYHDYLMKYQKPIIWLLPKAWLQNLFKSSKEGGDEAFDPYNLSKEEDEIAGSIRDKIKIDFDKKTAVISISVKDQDPLICKTIGDSVLSRLQDFITEYRTNKARIDFQYYQELARQAKDEYDKARLKYANTSDANTKVAMKSIEINLEDLENEMQMKYNAYTTVNTQMLTAKAKVQERTPAFTILKGASVPVKPSSPKRMLFVAVCMILTFIVTAVYVNVKRDI